MAMLILLALTTLAVSSTLSENTTDFLSDDYIQSINEEQKQWEAGRYFKKETPHSYIRYLLGVDLKKHVYIPMKEHNPHEFQIPKDFDARQHWPTCKSIDHIRDQGNCGSSWVVAAASAMSDRVCIESKGLRNVSVSAADLMQCCLSFHCGSGCFGGDPYAAWKFWHHYGLPSGGDFGTHEGCRPYPYAPYPECTRPQSSMAPCSVLCEGGGGLKFQAGYTRGASAYRLHPDEQSVQIELMQRGPVEAVLEAYGDFVHYRSGIYQKTSKAEYIGKLAVKIIGWGQYDGKPYWIAANSWGTSWGDGGYFKIFRGNNECKIQDYVIAGEVLTE